VDRNLRLLVITAAEEFLKKAHVESVTA
jgi:hypothetical protein